MKNALIAAVVAAIVAAASGTAATLVVTSKNIKNGTIQTADLSAKAKRALKGNRGPQGYEGAAGEPGAAGATNVRVRTFSLTVAPLAEAWAFIVCSSGERATGGGARGVPGLLVYDTHPTNGSGDVPAAGETPVGWRVGVDNYLNSSQTVTAFAVCSAP